MNQLSEEQPNWNIQASDELLSNWPIRDVLVALTHAATHLLTDHGCDAHGYEELQHAVVAARRHVLLDSDSQAADSDDARLDAMLKKAGLLHTCHRPHDAGTALERLARNVSDLAATAMRDKCVEKVKEMAEQWRQEASKAGRMFSDKTAIATKIAAELSSLTLDQVKPGEM